AIGLGRMIGLRYPENFHRPYLADSMREFWRRWHVTSITWLRDYLAFPMAGRDAPTLRLFPSIITGFALLGFWYGGGWTVALWAAYSSAFLAFEAVGFGSSISVWPKALRHLTIARYLTTQVWIALIVAVVGAGPLIPWLSRWRVSVDAVTAAIVMMI